MNRGKGYHTTRPPHFRMEKGCKAITVSNSAVSYACCIACQIRMNSDANTKLPCTQPFLPLGLQTQGLRREIKTDITNTFAPFIMKTQTCANSQFTVLVTVLRSYGEKKQNHKLKTCHIMCSTETNSTLSNKQINCKIFYLDAFP